MHPQFTSPTIVARFQSKFDLDGPVPPPWDSMPNPGPCHLWRPAQLGCYGYFTIWVAGKSYTIQSHRLAWILAHGPIPAATPNVCHHCDVRACGNVEHLFLGTTQDNMDDMVAKGRQAHGARHASQTHPELIARGERQHSAKLTAPQVIAIRAALAAGASKGSQAREYQVRLWTIQKIEQRKSWTYI